jgi:hypothetical protein
MVTTIGQRGDAAVLEAIGFAGYLAKPVRQAELFECLAMVLDKVTDQESPTGIVTWHTRAEAAKPEIRILVTIRSVFPIRISLTPSL